MFMVENVVNDTSSSIAASERPSRVGWVCFMGVYSLWNDMIEKYCVFKIE